MGQEIFAPNPVPDLDAALARLAAAGVTCQVLMVDGELRLPTLPPPTEWRDVRLRTPAGTVALKRRPDGVAIVVFGNAGPDVMAICRRVADALAVSDSAA